MHRSANWRTLLILLIACVVGGWSAAAMDHGESGGRLAIGGAVEYGGNPDEDRLMLDRAIDGGLSPMDEFDDALSKDLLREKKHGKERRGPKIWDQWGKWSSCSVTCGVGKIVRWRHCVGGGCAPGEKEAQIKSCTLPAC